MKNFKDLPLRERKASKKRLAIIDASILLLKDKRLAEIKIEDICDIAEISRSTFFAYFSRKQELLVYNIRLWGLQIGWEMAQIPREKLGLRYIEKMYMEMASHMKIERKYWADVMSLRASEPELIHRINTDPTPMIPVSDRLQRFPDKEGIDTFPEGTIYSITRTNLSIAVEKGELPPDTDVNSALIALNSVLYGVPVILGGAADMDRVGEEMAKQLKMIWKGLGGGID